MKKDVLWIGPGRSADPFRDVFSKNGVDIADFEDVDLALRAVEDLPLAVAIVWADAGEATDAIRRIREARPEIEVIAGTQYGVPLHVNLVLDAGATGVVDFRGEDASEIAKQLKEASERYERRIQERALLSQIRELNDEFLKNIVALERRNVDLELRVDAAARQSPFDDDGPYRVLVIDDEASICTLFSVILEEEDYEVTTAMSGEEGVARFEEKPFPLVITDKNLPGQSGHEVLAKIKSISAATDVIMITGYASKESAIEAVNAGASAYLEKPFNDIDTVLARIQTVIEEQRQRHLQRRYLSTIKDRNRDFLDKYKEIRAELDRWLRGKPLSGRLPGAAAQPS